MFEAVYPPSAEPLTVKEVRIHLRQAGDGDSPQPGDSPAMFEELPDTSWIKSKITTARESCEAFLGFPLTDALYLLTFADFTGRTAEQIRQNRFYPVAANEQNFLKLPQGFVELEAISFLDVNNISRVLPSSTYDFDPVTGLVFPDSAWPILSSRPQAVRLLARGAYGVDSPPRPVPQAIKHAMLLMIGEWNYNREQTIEGRVAETPLGVEYLLRPLRTRLGMA